MKTKQQCLQQAFDDYFQEGWEMELKDFELGQPDWLDAIKNAMNNYAHQQSLEFSKYLIENYKCNKIKEGNINDLMPRIYRAFNKDRG